MKLDKSSETETEKFSVKTRASLSKGPKASRTWFQTKYCINRGETNFSRSPKSQRFWQGAIYHVWTSHFDKHWRHSHFALSFLFNLRWVYSALTWQYQDIGGHSCAQWQLRLVPPCKNPPTLLYEAEDKTLWGFWWQPSDLHPWHDQSMFLKWMVLCWRTLVHYKTKYQQLWTLPEL